MTLRAFILILLFVTISSACSRCSSSNENQYNEKRCTRIISRAPSITELLFALDLGNNVKGVTSYCSYPPEAKILTKTGSYSDPSYETIAMLDPDVVFFPAEDMASQKGFEKLSLNAVALNTTDFQGLLSAAQTIGKQCRVETRAEQFVKNILARFEQSRNICKKNKGQRPSVLISVGRAQGSGAIKNLYAAGNQTFYKTILEALCAQNVIAGETSHYPKIGAETILTLNPDIVIDIAVGAGSEDVAFMKKEWESLRTLSAVKNNAVYIVTEQYATLPGPRIVKFLDDVAVMIERWRK